MLPKVDIPQHVFEGIVSIQNTKVKMLDLGQVFEQGKQLQRFDTLSWISNNKDKYIQGVDRGFTPRQSRTVLLRTAI
jgi:hypothetical protein